MDLVEAMRVLGAVGDAIRVVIGAQSACVGIPPPPVPNVRILPREIVKCRIDGKTDRCVGWHRGNLIVLNRSGSAFEHETFHHVLCARPGIPDPCDTNHSEVALWDACMEPKVCTRGAVKGRTVCM